LLDSWVSNFIELDLANDATIGDRIFRRNRVPFMEAPDELRPALLEQNLQDSVSVEKVRKVHVCSPTSYFSVTLGSRDGSLARSFS